MCGRFTLRAPAQVIVEQFQLSLPVQWTPRFNIAPTQTVLVVVEHPAGQRIAKPMSWGLVPSWAKDPSMASSLINARSETVAEKPSFRAAFRRRRCLVVADGYYEWKTENKLKQPYLIRQPSGLPFGIAGLWETWGDSAWETCTLITTDANERLRPIHNRMPVILEPDTFSEWLDPKQENPAQLLPLLRPADPDRLLAEPVSRHVNNARNDDPECVAVVRTLF